MRLRRRRASATLNITPLIDVVFQLLVFFMLSTNVARHRLIGVDSPEARQVTTSGEGAVVIQVEKDGAMLFDGRPTPRTDLIAEVAGVLRLDPNRAFLVRPGAGAPLQAAVGAYDDAKKGGARLISFSRLREGAVQ